MLQSPVSALLGISDTSTKTYKGDRSATAVLGVSRTISFPATDNAQNERVRLISIILNLNLVKYYFFEEWLERGQLLILVLLTSRMSTIIVPHLFYN